MSMLVYVYMCLRIYVFMYIYVYMCLCIYVFMYICVCVDNLHNVANAIHIRPIRHSVYLVTLASMHMEPIKTRS